CGAAGAPRALEQRSDRICAGEGPWARFALMRASIARRRGAVRIRAISPTSLKRRKLGQAPALTQHRRRSRLALLRARLRALICRAGRLLQEGRNVISEA